MTRTFCGLVSVVCATMLTTQGVVAETVTFEVYLSGDQQPVPVKTPAYGEATVILDTEASTVTVWLDAWDLQGDVTGSHIHHGGPGQSGPQLVVLIPPYSLPIVGAVIPVDPEFHDEILTGNSYINVHTLAHQHGEIRGQLNPPILVLPGIVSASTVATHTGPGDLLIDVDLEASVAVDSGAVTTETRVGGITRLEMNFVNPLDASVGGLGAAAMDITPDPGVAVSTSLANGNTRLVVTFTPALPGTETYAFALTDSVVAAGPVAPGDRDFELRALGGNVVSESGPGPQTVNAIDIGLSGIRGKFSADVTQAANTPFDVNQDGSINALDMSCVRLTCGLFGNSAP